MPYNSTSTKFNAAPTSPANVGIAARRVLNIPLLACTNAAGGNSSAALLGIGRFFMTVPAAPGSASAVPPTKDAVSAEFAGVVAQSTLGGPAELIR
jgi:hypothetical protein